MASFRKLLTALAASLALIVGSAQMAVAQVVVDPSTTPTKNAGGWVFNMAQLLTILGVITALFLIVMYMRYAPRFSKDEDGLKVVRADRVRPGQPLPRRAVDISQAAPVIVAPPAIPVPVGATAPAAATTVAPSTAPATAEAPQAPATAPAAAPASPPAPPPAAPAERVEVAMDQEVFDAKLAELLEAGTDRRVAEGQARRAGMIAARKKAEG
jgi:hypothetical protein